MAECVRVWIATVDKQSFVIGQATSLNWSNGLNWMEDDKIDQKAVIEDPEASRMKTLAQLRL